MHWSVHDKKLLTTTFERHYTVLTHWLITVRIPLILRIVLQLLRQPHCHVVIHCYIHYCSHSIIVILWITSDLNDLLLFSTVPTHWLISILIQWYVSLKRKCCPLLLKYTYFYYSILILLLLLLFPHIDPLLIPHKYTTDASYFLI